MLIKILILLLLLLTFKNTYEPFDQVLTLEKTKIYDIKNWKNIGNNTYVNYITIKAKTGKIGYTVSNTWGRITGDGDSKPKKKQWQPGKREK